MRRPFITWTAILFVALIILPPGSIDADVPTPVVVLPISATPDAGEPPLTVPVGTRVEVVGTAEGHPTIIEVWIERPDGLCAEIAVCPSAPCAGTVAFDVCGLWVARVFARYAHATPSGTQYVAVEETEAVADCGDLFADGFETGDASRWSRSVP